MRFDTIAVRGGYDSTMAMENQGAICEPAYLSPAQHFLSSEDMRQTLNGETKGWVYTRIDNPTILHLEATLAMLETYGGDIAASATVFSSGMAALFMAATALVAENPSRTSANIVLPASCYGGSFNLFRERFERDRSIELRWINNTLDLDEWARALDSNTRFALCEVPSNPLLRMTDITALSELTHRLRIPLMVDATVSGPAVLRPLLKGADIVVHSVSKSMSASGLSIAGAVIARHEIDAVHPRTEMFQDFAGFLKKGPQRDTGVILSPFNALQTIADLRSLRSRVAQMGASSLTLARFLAQHPKVIKVFYPGLQDTEGNDIARRDMVLVDSELDEGGAVNCFGHLLSVRFKGGPVFARSFMDALNLFWRANDLGRIKSTITIPSISTHSQLSDDDKSLSDIPNDLLRMSVGCEHVLDVLGDVERAISIASKECA